MGDCFITRRGGGGGGKSLPDFATATWKNIHNMIQADMNGLITLSDWWSLGDTKTVTLTTGEEIEFEIAGFNHDTFSDGVTAPATFIMKNCLNTKAQMNSTNTNAGGYPVSAMKTYVETNVYNVLPSEMKQYVSPVKKKCYTDYSDESSLTEADYNVWLLSTMEVFGEQKYAVGTGEGTLYPIFTDNASRKKYVNGSATAWWLRSVHSGGSRNFCSVGTDGTAYSRFASSSLGVAVGLCIR